MYPGHVYVEEGSYSIEEDLILVSPDGSIRQKQDTSTPKLAVEIKCPTANDHSLPVYYSITLLQVA